MKGRIDICGNLYIERAVMKAQFCPVQRLYKCGDWCPLFGEPYPHTERANPTNGLDRRMVETGHTALSLCHKTLIFDEFTDEREGGND